MSTDIDWQHELDTSFGTGHDVPRRALRRRGPVGPYAVAGSACRRRRGRHGRRRRRRCLGAVARARAARRRHARSPPQGPSPTDGTTVDEAARRAQEDRSAGLRAGVRASQEELPRQSGRARPIDGLVLRPGAGRRCCERVPNPMGYTQAQGSLRSAVRVDVRGARAVLPHVAVRRTGELSTTTVRRRPATSPAGSRRRCGAQRRARRAQRGATDLRHRRARPVRPWLGPRPRRSASRLPTRPRRAGRGPHGRRPGRGLRPRRATGRASPGCWWTATRAFAAYRIMRRTARRDRRTGAASTRWTPSSTWAREQYDVRARACDEAPTATRPSATSSRPARPTCAASPTPSAATGTGPTTCCRPR